MKLVEKFNASLTLRVKNRISNAGHWEDGWLKATLNHLFRSRRHSTLHSCLWRLPVLTRLEEAGHKQLRNQ
jgi:hypothetical protein